MIKILTTLLMIVIVLTATYIFLKHSNTFHLLRPAADEYCYEARLERLGFVRVFFDAMINNNPNFAQIFVLFGFREIGIDFRIVQFLIYISLIFCISLFLRTILKDVQTRIVPVYTLTASVFFIATISTVDSAAWGDSGVFITSFFWPAGQSRLMAIIILLLLLVSIFQNRKYRKKTDYILVSLLFGLGEAELLAVSLLFLILVFSELRFDRKVFGFYRNFGVATFGFILFAFKYFWPGSQVRLAKLDQSMRGGQEFSWSDKTIDLLRTNNERLIVESVSISAIALSFALGILLGLIIRARGSSNVETLYKARFATLVLFCLSILIAELTVMASLFAYLQSWHYSSWLILSYMAFFSLGLWCSLISNNPARKFLLLISALVILSTITNIVNNYQKISELLSNRATDFDSRTHGQRISIPLLSVDGKELTQDVESDWVYECFVNAPVKKT